MKRTLLLLLSIVSIISHIHAQVPGDSPAVDQKYGYKDIRFEMSADSLFKKIKGSLMKDSNKEFSSYIVTEPKYLKIGDCQLKSVIIDAINDKVFSIEITTMPDGYYCIKHTLEQLFGKGFQANEYIDRYTWFGKNAVVILDKNIANSSAQINLSSNEGRKALDNYSNSHAKKSASDF